MAVTADSPAPYTAGSAVINVIHRYRDKGLTTPITSDVLARAGVSDGLIPRTLQALLILELIDDSGQPTATFQKIRSVPQAEYKNTLAEWIRRVYADVFGFADPAQDDAIKVRDAFRTYIPHGQQDRMVALFLALCAEAGIVSEVKKAESKPRRSAMRPIKLSPASRQAVNKPVHTAPDIPRHTGLDPALSGLLQSIPSGGKGWTKDTRDKFVATFGVVLDFAVPIVSAESLEAIKAEGGP